MKNRKPEFLIEAEKRVKRFGDILRNILCDKGVVRYKISAVVDLEDLSEPKTIRILDRQRSADGGWSTVPLKDWNPDALQFRDTLKEELADIEKSVHQYIADNAMDADWEKCEASIDEVLICTEN